MVASAFVERVRQVLEPVVAADGLVLEDVEVRRSGSRSVVEVVLDLAEDAEGELDLDRVADATRAVSDALDAADVVAGEYTLEVGSRGVSRPLTARRHFVRAVGRTVALTLADGSTLRGRLDAVERGGADAGDEISPSDDSDAVVVVPVTPGVKGRKPKIGAPVRVALTQVVTATVEVDLTGLGPVDDEIDDTDGDVGQES